MITERRCGEGRVGVWANDAGVEDARIARKRNAMVAGKRMQAGLERDRIGLI
jgi:hypothetical protein